MNEKCKRPPQPRSHRPLPASADGAEDFFGTGNVEEIRGEPRIHAVLEVFRSPTLQSLNLEVPKFCDVGITAVSFWLLGWYQSHRPGSTTLGAPELRDAKILHQTLHAP